MNLKFRTLVKLYENDVYSLALYLLHDRSEAEDMAQETYIKLWQHLDQVKIRKAKAWLLRVTRNRCLDHLRRRGLENDVSNIHPVTQALQEPEITLIQEQRNNWLKRNLENLKEPYRSLIILRDIHQNSYSDIADTMELSLDQVKVYLYRARQQLKTRLQEVEL